MSDFQPGQRIIYRDGAEFNVAKVDLVREGHVTAFPFDHRRRGWSRSNRRIARGFVIGRVRKHQRLKEVAASLKRLHNEREATRQMANRILADRVQALSEELN